MIIPTLAAARGNAAEPPTIRTRRISVAEDGSQLARASESPRMSPDGRFIAFASRSPKLISGDDNRVTDVFVWDRTTKKIEMISVSSKGEPGNGPSFPNALSSDGRFVVFTSVASNFVEGDVDPGLEEALDVFIHDRDMGTTERISVNSVGDPALGPSFDADVSADGRFVAFVSGADNLDENDKNGTYDVFVRDRELGTTDLVSKNSDAEAGNLSSFAPSISADGSLVAFDSDADNLVEGDTNFAADTFAHHTVTGATRLASVSSEGILGRWGGVDPIISADGRFVTFLSESKLVPRDTNRVGDAYLHDFETGRTTRVSLSSTGRQGRMESFPKDISDDGRFVLFVSKSAGFVPRDTNDEYDHFLFDRSTKKTVRVNVSSQGRQAEGDKGFQFGSSISGDGRSVAFESSASNLVRNDTNNSYDIFVRGPLDI